jgi:hypothetical protein
VALIERAAALGHPGRHQIEAMIAARSRGDEAALALTRNRGARALLEERLSGF